MSINLPFPPSKNALTSVRRVKSKKTGKWVYRKIKTARYGAWEKEAGWNIQAYHTLHAVEGPYHLQIELVRPDNRKRDVGNYDEAIFDLLSTHGITPDDSLAQSLMVRWSDAQDGPTVKVRAG